MTTEDMNHDWHIEPVVMASDTFAVLGPVVARILDRFTEEEINAVGEIKARATAWGVLLDSFAAAVHDGDWQLVGLEDSSEESDETG